MELRQENGGKPDLGGEMRKKLGLRGRDGKYRIEEGKWRKNGI